MDMPENWFNRSTSAELFHEQISPCFNPSWTDLFEAFGDESSRDAPDAMHRTARPNEKCREPTELDCMHVGAVPHAYKQYLTPTKLEKQSNVQCASTLFPLRIPLAVRAFRWRFVPYRIFQTPPRFSRLPRSSSASPPRSYSSLLTIVARSMGWTARF